MTPEQSAQVVAGGMTVGGDGKAVVAGHIDTVHVHSSPAPVPPPTRKLQNLPFASLGDLFKGREADLKSLEDQLARHGAAAIVQPASITGMGGIGKTRLAIEYAIRNQEKFSALLFVSANTPQELESNLALLSSPEVLDLPAYQTGNQPNQHSAVLQWLQANDNWLLILDNVDTLEAVQAVQELAPKLPGGQLLITSRITAWGGSIRSVGLHLLSEEAAVSYLLDRTRDQRQPQLNDDAQAKLIAEDLGCLALALEQATAYVNAQAISFAEYRTRWQASNEKLIGFHDKLTMEYPKSVLVTLQTTIDQLSLDGLKLLKILAWLAPDPIPRSLFTVQGGPFGAESEDGLPEEAWPAAVERAEAALAELVRFSLAAFSDEKMSFSVHRLVQAVARRSQSEAEQQSCVASALRWVNAGFPYESSDVRFWPIAEALAPHALVIAKEADRRLIPKPTSRLMGQLGIFYQSRAEWGQAEPLMRRALDIDEKSYGSEHPNVARGLNNLAQLLQDTNRLAEAEPLMRRALQIDEKSYGSDHPNVARDLNNLAQLLKATNRLAEAEPLMRRALEIDEKSYGSEHPDVAIDLNNLARLLQDTNRLAEAEPLMRRALQIDEKSYGSDHPGVAIDLNNLAQLLQATNRLAEAEPLMRRGIAIFEKSLGENHPNVAVALNNLATLLRDTNRLAEAEPLMRRALQIDEGSYGSDHPNVAIRLNNLAQLLQATNRLAEAEPLMRRALQIDEKSYGSDHPNVAIDLNNLAQLLKATNRLAEAEPLMRRHLEIFFNFTRATGHPHPHLQAAVNNYRSLLEEMGMSHEEALARLRKMAPELFG